MTPILLIVAGFIVIAITIWDIRREESDMLFWMDFLWWKVNRTENPLIYQIALIIQFTGAVMLIGAGALWLALFG